MPSTKPVPGVNRCEAPLFKPAMDCIGLEPTCLGTRESILPGIDFMAEDYVWDTKSNGHRD
jgi:hypothetical protein